MYILDVTTIEGNTSIMTVVDYSFCKKIFVTMTWEKNVRRKYYFCSGNYNDEIITNTKPLFFYGCKFVGLFGIENDFLKFKKCYNLYFKNATISLIRDLHNTKAHFSSLLRAVITCNHLLFFKILLNFGNLCPDFQIFCPFSTCIWPFSETLHPCLNFLE